MDSHFFFSLGFGMMDEINKNQQMNQIVVSDLVIWIHVRQEEEHIFVNEDFFFDF